MGEGGHMAPSHLFSFCLDVFLFQVCKYMESGPQGAFPLNFRCFLFQAGESKGFHMEAP